MHRIPRGIHLQALLHSPLHQLQPLLANLLPLLIHKHHRPAPGEGRLVPSPASPRSRKQPRPILRQTALCALSPSSTH